MTVAISCNLSEGVILGVDSAVTIPAPGGTIAKVYEDAEKLFQLGNMPIGLAIYGLGGFGDRSIGSYLREFEISFDEHNPMPDKIPDVVEQLRNFFMNVYSYTIIPAMMEATGKTWELIEDKPNFGMVIGGFSKGEYLSEVWQLSLPDNSEIGSATQIKKQGEFGTNWYAMYEPIFRYVKGYSIGLIEELIGYLCEKNNIQFTEEIQNGIIKILSTHEYSVPFQAMPMKCGIDHVRFLLELVIGHHKYSNGAPVVGGKPKIGMVNYRGEKFSILD